MMWFKSEGSCFLNAIPKIKLRPYGMRLVLVKNNPIYSTIYRFFNQIYCLMDIHF